MTTLYTTVYRSSGNNESFSFDTDDDFPHVGGVVAFRQDHSFHILRSGEKSLYTCDAMMTILKFALSQFKFKYKTAAPQIVDNEYELLELDGTKAALIDFEDYFVVSTIVTPITTEEQEENDQPTRPNQ